MSLTQYYTATTLDGFIADPDNSLDWLFTRRREPDGLLSYDAFIAEVGAIAMGSTTYEWLLEHVEHWPYELPCWVFTHRDLRVVPDAPVELVRGDVSPVHAQMAAPPVSATSGSSAVVTSPASSQTRGCWTR